MRMINAYIKYRRKAKTRHGIHSPFMYEFIDQVLYASHIKSDTELIALRNHSNKYQERHLVNDLGAGSRISRAKPIRLGNLSKRASSPLFLSRLIQRCIAFYGYHHILELGTHMGHTTAYLAAASTKPKVISIEGDVKFHELAKLHLKQLDLQADLRQGNFDTELSSVLNELTVLDLAYIDGNHRLEPSLRYVKACIEFLQKDGLIIIGDIHWSTEMELAWEEIKKLPQVTATVDIFYAGLVWIKPELSPEHFTLKH